MESKGLILAINSKSPTRHLHEMVNGKFRIDAQTDTYSVALKEGDKIVVNAKVFADTQTLAMIVSDPVGRKYYEQGLRKEHTYTSPTLGGEGAYTIAILNSYSGFSGGLGSYTLSIGCTLTDGTVIKPGAAAKPTSRPGTPGATQVATSNTVLATPTTLAPTATPAFSGVGFPGLPAVDFTKGFEVPLTITAPFNGALTPGSGDVLALPFDGKANDTIVLDFTRLSGNLNIGIALLAPDNTLLFHSTLLTSDLVSTRLKLPAVGKYTLGVFRVGINEPAKPTKTTFRVQIKLNPK